MNSEKIDSEKTYSEIFDCAIIGAGPAGIISAIQLKRLGFNIIIIEKSMANSLLRNANKIENYLGFPDSINGNDLLEIFHKQLLAFGINKIIDEVFEITKLPDKNTFKINTKANIYIAKSVIIATGTKPRAAGIDGEKQFYGKKVFYELKELPLFLLEKIIKSSQKSAEILIIGGGDSAFDYAVNLHEKGHNPLIIVRNKITCLNKLLEAVKIRKIPYFENMQPLCITEEENKERNKEGNKEGNKERNKEGNKERNSVVLKCRNNGRHNTFKADFVLIAAGREPAIPQINNIQFKFENNASKDGLFFAGDVKNGKYRQIHIAAGDAMQTAIMVKDYLQNNLQEDKRTKELIK